MATKRSKRIILFLGLIATTVAFNLEPRIPVLKNGPINTYFGFSVAEHRIFSNEENESVLLVGAPRAQTSQVKNKRSGSLFRCPMTTNRTDCTQVKISIDIDEPYRDELRDDQWLGVVVRSEAGNQGKILVCAHRYTKQGELFRWVIGLCYALTNVLDYDVTYEPCAGRSVQKGHEEFGVCQAGTSAAISEDGYLIMGTPGAFTWRGMIFSNSMYSGGDRDRRWHNSPYLANNCPVDKYSYLGFGVAVGKFYPNASSYATGAPRSNGTGQVVLFKRTSAYTIFEVMAVLTGDMFASSFGYELAAADLNNDGLSDLIVGAPFYFDESHGGAIYIYINKPGGITADIKPIKVLGSKESRFGISIANIGDLNKDGYQDIAIGAPYEGSGRVYIYHGSKTGINIEPTQVIKPIPPFKDTVTFGYSLSGGIDMDRNGYPDLLVGSYESDQVVLLRSRPVINILTEVRHIPKNINPLEHHCKDDGEPLLCFSFQPCFKFETSAHHQSDSKITMVFKIEAETFLTKKSSRVFFRSARHTNTTNIAQRTRRVELAMAKDFTCHTEVVYLKENTTDYLTSVSFKMTYTINQTSPEMPPENRPLPNIDNYPILDQREASKTFEVHFKKNCGDDDICVSDLQLSASFDLPRDVDGKPYLSSKDRNVSIDIILENHSNESAYETVIFITHPIGVSYSEQISHGKQYPYDIVNSTMIKFFIGNPFLAHGKAKFAAHFKLTGLQSDERKLMMVLRANTTSQERMVKDSVTLVAKIVVSADLEVTGSSNPSTIFYGGKILGESAIEREEQIGDAFFHHYEIKNKGPGIVDSFDVIIQWPYEAPHDKRYKHGKWLLYMTSYPVVQGYGACRVDPRRVNPRNIELNKTTASRFPKANVNPRDVKNSNQINSRQKREEIVVKTEKVEEENKIKTIVVMECGRGTAKCFEFSCTIKDLAVGGSVIINITARLWEATLIEDYPRVDAVRIYSNASIFIDPALEVIQNVLNDRSSAMIEAIPEPALASDIEGPPIWIIILSVIAGILLVALLVFCLWKLGFFKRNKPDALVNNTHRMDHADL